MPIRGVGSRGVQRCRVVVDPGADTQENEFEGNVHTSDRGIP
jgi:hypothetical protein